MNNETSLIAVLILVLACLACDGASRIGGRVVDAEGRPINDASVLFEAVEKGEPERSYQCEARTASDGLFGCGFVHAPWNIRLRLTIGKEGYNTYTREFSAKELAASNGGNMGSQVIILESR